MDDFQTIINGEKAAALGAMGWFARQLWDAVKELKADLTALRVEIARDYVAKTDFNPFAAEIRSLFQRIYDKLDDKADK